MFLQENESHYFNFRLWLIVDVVSHQWNFQVQMIIAAFAAFMFCNFNREEEFVSRLFAIEYFSLKLLSQIYN